LHRACHSLPPLPRSTRITIRRLSTSPTLSPAPPRRAAWRRGSSSAPPASSGSEPLRETAPPRRAQHHRQLAGFAYGGNALRDLAMPERDALEEPQRANGLVHRRPRDPDRDEVDLKGAHLLQTQQIRRAATITAELRDRVDVSGAANCGPPCPRSCGGAEGSSQPSGTPVCWIGLRQPRPCQTGDLRRDGPATSRGSGLVQPPFTTPSDRTMLRS
jgi:hypothetical protein